MNYDEIAERFKQLIENTQRVVVLQGDNPDGDSLASALALEQILGQMGKDVYLYCSIDIPEHMRFIEGWDRVSKDFPSNFDIAIIVDCGFWNLFGNLTKSRGQTVLPSDKLILIDHHDASPHDMEAALDINDAESSATSQVIYEIVSRAGIEIDITSATRMAESILADTLGFTSEALLGHPRPLEIMAELVGKGVDLASIQQRRLERLKITPDLLHYRGELLQRVEFHGNGRIAMIDIPYDEIRERSQEFNPTIILDETRNVEGVAISIGLKQYVSQGRLVKVTARIRCNRGVGIADQVAKIYGEENGGGHPYASGFKLEGKELNYSEIKNQVIARTIELLDQKH